MNSRQKLLSVHHFLVAIVLILKGIDKISHHHDVIGWTILVMGIFILFYFLFSKYLTATHAWSAIVVHLFESVALFLTTYVYFQEGKSLLPYFTLIAAVGYLVGAIIHLMAGKKHASRT